MACQVNKFYISTVLTSIRLGPYVLVKIRVLCCVATSAGWDKRGGATQLPTVATFTTQNT